jgi:uncharacterized protein (DUF952 family)
MIYKIFKPNEWAKLQQNGTTEGAPIDIQDGYIHFSTAEQVRETARKHFAGAGDLILLAADDTRLGNALKWEVSRGGALFPHLYRNLNLDDVSQVYPLPEVNSAHVFPERL